METEQRKSDGLAHAGPARTADRANRRPASTVRAGRLFLFIALLLGPAVCTRAAVEGDRRPAGPVVAVPHCKVFAQDCGLDPATPALSPAGCAMEVARRLGRRGVTTRLIGPTAIVCAPGSDALVAEVTLTATCSSRVRNKLPAARVKSVRVAADLTLRDCASGETVGRARSKRQIETGRHHLVRDLIEELGHHISEMKIRRTHPRTPIRWFGPDVGGERSAELLGGVIDVEDGDFGDLLEAAGMERAERAVRISLGFIYHPWHSPYIHAGLGIEAMRIKEDGTGDFTSELLGLDTPGITLTGARASAELSVLGITGILGWGFDFTRNQRLGGILAGGYYVLGPGFARADVEIEGLPGGEVRLRDANVGGWADLRYEWRFTPHLALVASYGYNLVKFRRPNIDGNRGEFPYDVEYTGPAGRAGLAVRY